MPKMQNAYLKRNLRFPQENNYINSDAFLSSDIHTCHVLFERQRFITFNTPSCLVHS